MCPLEHLASQIALNTYMLLGESNLLLSSGFSDVPKWLSAGLYFVGIYKQQRVKLAIKGIILFQQQAGPL